MRGGKGSGSQHFDARHHFIAGRPQQGLREAVCSGLELIVLLIDEIELLQDERNIAGFDLLGQYARSTQRARLTQIQLAFLRGVHEDGNTGGKRIGLDGLHRLETIHARHQMVHKDDVRPLPLELRDGGFGGIGGIDFQAVFIQQARQESASRAGIIDDEGALGSHAATARTSGRQSLTQRLLAVAVGA